MPFCPGAGAGTTRDTRPRDTPGHGHGARPGTPRDTHPGHPGTTCIYEGRGARDLIRDTGPKRRQKDKTYRYRVASRTHQGTASNKGRKKDRRKPKGDKNDKNKDFPKYFLRPSPAFSGPIPGFSPEFPAEGSENIFPARGRRWPERAGENTKNHFNLAPAVSQFHGCCRIAPAYCFGSSKIFP